MKSDCQEVKSEKRKVKSEKLRSSLFTSLFTFHYLLVFLASEDRKCYILFGVPAQLR